MVPWFDGEPDRTPLAPRCELCSARHLDGDPCLVVRVLPPGVMAGEGSKAWGNHATLSGAAKASHRAKYGREAWLRREGRKDGK